MYKGDHGAETMGGKKANDMEPWGECQEMRWEAKDGTVNNMKVYAYIVQKAPEGYPYNSAFR